MTEDKKEGQKTDAQQTAEKYSERCSRCSVNKAIERGIQRSRTEEACQRVRGERQDFRQDTGRPVQGRGRKRAVQERGEKPPKYFGKSVSE